MSKSLPVKRIIKLFPFICLILAYTTIFATNLPLKGSVASPTDILLSNNTVNEKVTAPALIGNFSTTDADVGDTFTYTLVSGTGSTDNSSFNISGNALSINQSPDFANQSSYTIRVRTTDNGGDFYEKTFTIAINDVTNPLLTLPANANRNTTAGLCGYLVQGTEFDPTTATDNSGNVSTNYTVQRLLPNPNLITENFNNGSWNTANFEIGSPNGSVVNGAYQSATADNRGTLRTVNNWIPSVNNPLYVSATLTFSGFSIAFIGTRSTGLKNPSASNEPNNSQYFRIHNFNNGQTDISSTGYTGRPGDSFYNNPVRVEFIDNGINITGTMTNLVTNQVLSFNQNTSYSSGSWRVVFSGSNVNWDDIKISLGAPESLQTITTGSSSLAGISLATGENTIKWQAVDGAGNNTTATMKVTVVDAQKPTITTSANIDETTLQGVTNKSIAIGDATVADNCGTTTLTWAMTGATTATGTNQLGTKTFNTGLTTVTYTVIDASGNQEIASFNVSVKEAQSIAFGAIATKTYGDADFSPGATSSANLSVSYTSSNLNVATIVNGKIHIIGQGTSTITAIQGGNNAYSAATGVSQTLTVDKKALTLTAQTIAKVYDGTDTAPLTFNAITTANGLVATDDVVAVYGSATFDNKNVGTTKPVTVVALALSGNDSGNYSINTFNATGTITQKAITVTAQTDTKIYDGTNASAISPSITALATGDNITTQPTQTFDNKNVGTVKTLTASGLVVADGNSGNNYSISYVTATGTITQKAITVTAQTDTKTYDGTNTSAISPSVTAFSTGDNITTQPTQTFDSKNVGTGKTLTASGLVVADGNNGNNYSISYVTATGTISQKSITVTAQTDTKIYDGSNASAISPSVTALATGDNITTQPTQTFGSKNVGTAKTLTASGLVVADGNNGNNYSISYVTATGAITQKAIVVTAQTDTKIYDGSNASTISPSVTALATGDNITTQPSQTFDSKNVGTGKTLTASGLVISDSNSGNNYSISYVTATGAITQKAITVTAQTDTKTYDGTNTSAISPSVTALATGDNTTTQPTQTFDSKNVGTGKTLTASGLVISDSNSGNNYSISYVTATGAITQKAITVTAQTDTKTYDGTNTSAISPSVTALATGDNTTTQPTQTFDSKNVGTAKTLTASGLVISDGNSGNNYSISYVTATGAITQKAITVTAQTDTKIYDGTVSSNKVPTITALALGDNITTQPTQTFDSRNVGTAKTLTASGLVVADGNSGNNYSISYVTATGTITQKGITVTAQTDTKVYDGTNASTISPLVTALATGDNITTQPTQTFDTKNVGATKTLTASGLVVADGNSGNNYSISYVTATGAITQKAITVTAQTDTKIYDGTNASTISPSVTALATGDNITTQPTQTFDSKNVGTGKTLTASGLVISDGNSGNNYSISYVTATGKITQKAITVTAQTDTKIYDGTVSSNKVPTATTLSTGDNITTQPTQTFDSKNVGTGKTIIASGLVISDGNSGNNYSISYVAGTGTITQKTITVTAQTDTKIYDGNNASTISTSVTALATGDNITTQPTQTFDSKNVGTAKTLIASGLVVADGNSGNNYSISYVTATGKITQKAITVTAQTDTKTYDGSNASTISPSVTALATGDNITTQPAQTFDSKNVGTAKTLTASGLVVADGNSGNNYSISYVTATGTITQKAITVTAQTDTKIYDGAVSSNKVPTATALVAGDNLTTQATQTFDNKNVGTGKILTASGLIINDGNNGNNYSINYVNSSGNITAAILTFRANPATKVYGDANPILSGTITGFINNDNQANSTTGTLVFNTTATAISGIGNYDVVGSGLTSPNYAWLQAPGNNAAFIITPRSIAITADTKTKIYGDNDPNLTFRISGNLVNGDTFTGNLIRAAGNNAGNYTITQGTLALNSNYTLTYQSANLIINKATLTITANDAVRCVGNSNPAFSVNYLGFQYNDTPNSLTTNPAISTSANLNSTAGNYPLIPSNASSSNYNFVYINGTLKINPLPQISITSDKGDLLSKGETATLSATSINGTAYSWSNAQGILTGTNTATIKVRPLVPTTYSVTVTNGFGCQSTSSITIGVAEDYQVLKAENFITPNGDGQNDTWVVHNIDAYPSHSLTIVDRAGKVVYQTRNYKNDWDGTFQGTSLQQGTYYYVFRFDKPDIGIKKGFITIIRQGQ